MNENRHDVSSWLKPGTDITAVVLRPLVLIAAWAAADVVAGDVQPVSREGEEAHYRERGSYRQSDLFRKDAVESGVAPIGDLPDEAAIPSAAPPD